jgi:TATA-box binding protein (TBP) (component of TFIID and TFIIIB)
MEEFESESIEITEVDPPTKLVVKPDGNIIDFEELLTTTKTVIAITNLNINIKNFFKYMPITEYTPIEKKRGRKPKLQPPVFIKKIPVGSIICLKYGNIVKGVELKKKKKSKPSPENTVKKDDDFFRHSVSCVMMVENNKTLNIKVPANGKLQMTGCKTDDHAVTAVIQLCKIMTEVEKWTNESLFTVKGDNVEAIFNVVMNNKGFKIGFRINRQNLDTFINQKTNFRSIFEASTSTGINMKIENKPCNNRQFLKLIYNFKEDIITRKHISYEDYYCLLDEKEKESESDPTYITFFVFSSGTIIMSGREYNMKDFFYDVVKILVENRKKFEEKAIPRKPIRSKTIRRSNVELEPEI